MSEMSVHEPGAQWLTPQDVDRDVRALSEALLEQRAERIARNILAPRHSRSVAATPGN